jgi:2-oxoglutarate ferredoxin oxidoreductase subunit alpha
MHVGISYMAGFRIAMRNCKCMLEALFGNYSTSQADYFQTVNGGGHGDYKMITLAPALFRNC